MNKIKFACIRTQYPLRMLSNSCNTPISFMCFCADGVSGIAPVRACLFKHSFSRSNTFLPVWPATNQPLILQGNLQPYLNNRRQRSLTDMRPQCTRHSILRCFAILPPNPAVSSCSERSIFQLGVREKKHLNPHFSALSRRNSTESA